jgi:hypothetical protein
MIRRFRNACGFLSPERRGFLSTNRFSPKLKPTVKVHVSGYGILGDSNSKTLKCSNSKKASTYFTANYIEDAALILLSRVNHDGYLKGRISAWLADGATVI